MNLIKNISAKDVNRKSILPSANWQNRAPPDLILKKTAINENLK
jgi:hypothetical protein